MVLLFLSCTAWNNVSLSRFSESPLPSSSPVVAIPNKDAFSPPKQQQQREKVLEAADSQQAPREIPQQQQPVIHHDPKIIDIPQRQTIDDTIQQLRLQYQNDPSEVFAAINLADALRHRDLTFHDGGTTQSEAIATYKAAISLISQKRSQHEIHRPSSLNLQLFLDNAEKSVDGLYVATCCSLAKQYFMANMFEKAISAYNMALAVDPQYLDALCYRASTYIILGQYKEAAEDYVKVLELDSEQHLFMDAFTGLSKVLSIKESVVPNGWNSMVSILDTLIPIQESRLYSLSTTTMQQQQHNNNNSLLKRQLMDNLKKMHLALFAYHDVKTLNTRQAWYHLTRAYEHKLALIPPWKEGQERQSVSSVKKVFTNGFWPPNVGSTSRVPIFIIGFVRSGSTLLERVLDSHSQIAGTGEDSVFNGRLDQIRTAVIDASMTGLPQRVREVVEEQANLTIDITVQRWNKIEDATSSSEEDSKQRQQHNFATKKKNLKRFADKMLTNYMNVGFIHLLFPNALILHVAREPMDSIFSAYKHDFPPGGLDYTCQFSSLAALYRGYREVMTHWDTVLPGRVTHVRYEDMVSDMPGIAKAIITKAVGLEWEEDVLNFHSKKHTVNTLSTAQVRKGVYKDGIQSWKRYQEEMQPMVRLLGEDLIRHEFKTTIAGYSPPPLVFPTTESVTANS